MRQAQRREATRKAVVEAAAGLFGRQGFRASTMDGIAAAAGVAKGAVYHHFPTKEAVFEAVFEATSAELAARLARLAGEAPDVLEAMSAATEAYFEACSEGEIGQIILKDGPAVLGWRRWREIDEEHFGRTIPAALALAMDQGLISRQPAEPLARLLLGAVTEAAAACAQSASPRETGAEHAAAFRSLLQGLRRPAGRT